MQKKNFIYILLAGALCVCAVILTGCSSEGGAPSAAAEPGGLGVYQGDLAEGVRGSASVYAPANDAGPAMIEELRTALGQATYTYITLDVDNRQGKQPVNVQEIQVTDAAGKLVTFKLGFNQVGEMDNVIPSDNTDLYNKSVNIYNELLKQKRTESGQRQTVTFVATEQVVPAKVAAIVYGQNGPVSQKFTRL